MLDQAAQLPAIVAPPMWDLSCPDWEDRIRQGRSLVPDLPLFQSEADIALAFYDELQLPDVPGTPYLRDASGQWFRDIVRVIFGAWNPVDRVRMIRDLFVLAPKGSSKTSYSAALMLVAMLMNFRPRAEALFVGPTQAIADRAYEQATGMIDLSRDLKRRFRPRDHIKTIEDLVTGAELKVKTFDLSVLTGAMSLIFVLVDELHVLGRKPFAGKVLRQIRGGLDKTQEGALLITTTQSDDAPAGAFKSELKLARNIRNGLYRGKIIRPMLPLLHEFPRDIATLTKEERANGVVERWRDPENWPMVMPNLGLSVHMNDLVADWNTESEKGPDAIKVWASQHLNIEIGVGYGSEFWRGADYWEAAADETLTLETLLERSEVITIGIDGGGLDDLLGLSVIGRERDTREWLSWSRAWANPKVLQVRPEIAAVLQDFADDEEISIAAVPDDVVELGAIIAMLLASGLLPEKNGIGIDPNNAAAVIEALTGAGVPDEMIRRLLQGPALAPAVYGLERKLSDGTFWHAAQAFMDWCVGNAKTEDRGNAVMITKAISGRGKIDPVIALLQAAILMSWNPTAGTLLTGSDMLVMV